MKARSGLSSECLGFVGQRLELRLEAGEGWRVLEECGRSSRVFEEGAVLEGKMPEFMPIRFYRHYGVLRAFKAVVLLPGQAINGMETLAFSLDEGFYWNFSDKLCPRWGLLFGKGEPHFPFWKAPESLPTIFKSGILVGYGSEMRRKARAREAAAQVALVSP